MVVLKCPGDSFKSEREYIYDVILNEFLGVEYELKYEKRDNISITYNDKELLINDMFFHMCPSAYLTVESMPHKIDWWNCNYSEILVHLLNARVPILYGNRLDNNDYIYEQPKQISIGIDVFGSAFFMLARYEECVNKKRDENDFDHFSSRFSLAGENGFVERPIINEYIEMLWWGLNKLWPDLKRKKREYRLVLTHDVDRPSLVFNFIENKIHFRRLIGDIVVRKSMKLALRRLCVLFDFIRFGFQAEWKYTFDYIMDKSDQYGVKSTFFFMTPRGINNIDGDYSINNVNIVNIIKHIMRRGHCIGLHPEYESYLNDVILRNNVGDFKKILMENGIECEAFGARQHYLRWENSTWDCYEDCGIEYDTTLSFADHIGFRCGICYDYPVYSLKRRQKLQLREYPLIVMDGSALGYMGLSFDEAAIRIIELKNICKKYNGNFVLLWHNDTFLDDRMKKLYNRILNG